MEEKLSRPHLDELDYFNGICCLLVMLGHTLSYGITELNRSSWQMLVVYVPWKISGVAVMAFLFTGAVKISLQFESGRKISYLPYIWRRIWKIYIPYVIAVVIYFIVFARIAWVEVSGKSFLTAWLTGNISAQFYYVIIVMQFYILMPLWRWIVKHIPWYIALTLAMMVTLAMIKGDALLEHNGISFGYCDRVFPTYLFYWMLGLYVGQHYSDVQRELSRNKLLVFLSGLAILCFVLVAYRQYATDYYLYETGYIMPFSNILTICFVLCLCLALKESHAVRLKRAMTWLHRASYSVYLYHCLFLTLVQYVLWQYSIMDIGTHLAVRTVVCFTVPFILYWLISQVKSELKAQ